MQLYNVVVETEQVGKKLLEKGELRRRVTIIPLNKIASTTISNDAVRRAESLVTVVAAHSLLKSHGVVTLHYIN